MEFEDDDIFGEVAKLKTVDRNVTADTIAERLNIQQKALLAANGDTQRTNERIERMAAELGGLLKQRQAEGRVELDFSDVDPNLLSQFVRADGSVRFRTEKVPYLLPNGATAAMELPGLLDSASLTPEMERLRRAYGGYALAYHRCKRNHMEPWADPLVLKAWQVTRVAMSRLPGVVGKFCRAALQDDGMFKRVISSATGYGGEFLSVPTTSNVIRPMDLARRVPGLVRMLPAPSPSFKRPIITGRGLMRRRGATTSNPSAYPQQNFTTSSDTTSVVDMTVSAVIDPLWVNDASAVLSDPMAEVMNWLAQAYADTLEISFLHGDTAATHQDAIDTWTLNSYLTAGQMGGSDSPAKFWIGWRARAFDDSNNIAGGGTWDTTDQTSAMSALGLHAGGRVVNLMGLKTLYTQIIGNSNFLTVQNYGQAATLLTGEVGALFGKPAVISEFMTPDLASTGLYTGSGSTGSILVADADAYEYYEMTGGDDFDQLYPERGAQYVGMVRRGVLTPRCPSAEKPCAVIVNL